jgi:hypothetical protein
MLDDQAALPGAEHRAVALDMLQGQVVDRLQFQRVPVQALHLDEFFVGDFGYNLAPVERNARLDFTIVRSTPLFFYRDLVVGIGSAFGR